MLHWTLRDWRVQLLIVLLWDGVCASKVKPTIKPLFSRKPFLFAWNIPTQTCGSRYGVPLELDQFQVVTTPSQDSVGQKLTLFYHNRLGLYPFYKADGTAVHGGLPQIGNLSQHLSEMEKGVDKYIPNRDSVGLAVIDWEEWRPLWVRNWGGKDIYRERSRELVQQKNPTWSEKEAKKVAQLEYEMSGKKFMQETLRHAKHLRPNNLWGYYLFPDCYNHDYMKSMDGYTGHCPDLEVTRNDQLEWLFAESTALFPSIYLRKMLSLTSAARLFVRNRVKEGMHRASSSDEVARPVFVYARPIYVDSPQYMPEFDLVSTIGESVALGAAGIIMWGDVTHAKNKTACSELNTYLQGTLSQYLLNVSTAAELCSKIRCGSHGRCLRKDPDSDVYLHLSPRTHRIQRRKGKLTVTGKLRKPDKMLFETDFQCQCYKGFEGNGCTHKDPPDQKGTATRTRTSALQCVIILITVVLLC